MRWGVAGLAATLWLGVAAAQMSAVGPSVVEPGTFAAIVVSVDAPTELLVEAPTGFTGPDRVRVAGGSDVIYLHVGSAATAGDHVVKLIDRTGNSVEVIVAVARRVGVELVAPDSVTVVRGDTIEHHVLIENTGNAVERVTLTVQSQLAPSDLELSVDLEPGEARSLSLGTWTTERTGADLAVVRATPSSDPSRGRFAVIRTTVLPFAGADEIAGPVLQYGVEASVGYGSSGFLAGLRTRLGGDLSDYVTGQADVALDVRPDLRPALSGYAALTGEGWSARYQGRHLDHSLSVTMGDVSGFVATTELATTIGAVYRPGDLYLSATQTFTDRSIQRLDLGYRFSVAPELTLMPLVRGQRSAGDGDAELALALALTATFDTAPVLGLAHVELPYRLDRGWSASAAVMTRANEPFGARADLALTGGALVASATLNESVSEEVTLRQRLSYGATSSVAFGVRYEPLSEPMTLDAQLGASLANGQVGTIFQLSASYRPSPFSVAASVAGDTHGTLTYGASLGYQDPSWGASIGYRHDEDGGRIDASLAARGDGFTGRAAYRYELAGGTHSGSLSFSYRPERQYRLDGGLELGEELTWSVSVTYLVEGGFPMPDPVVDAFGGLRTGTVSGTVFLDLDRDGQRDADEPPVTAAVQAGRAGTSTAEDGTFHLVLAPGVHVLAVSRLPATLGVDRDLRVEVKEGNVVELDVPVVEVATAVVTVFSDGDRDGVRSSTEHGMPGVRVVFRDEAGTTTSVVTNERGEAVLQNAEPGGYTVSIDEASLPASLTSSTPGRRVDLRPGPMTRVELGIAEKPRETIRSYTSSDLSLVARTSPTPVPPGADLLVTAEVLGALDPIEVSLEAVLPSGETIALEPLGDRSFAARVPVPPDAKGALLVTLRATAGSAAREQVLPVVVAPGPLATLTVTPATSEPGDLLVVEATFLKRVEGAAIVFDGVTVDLQPTEDPYVFRIEFPAPSEPGAYDAVLLGDGESFARGRFRVQ